MPLLLSVSTPAYAHQHIALIIPQAKQQAGITLGGEAVAGVNFPHLALNGIAIADFHPRAQRITVAVFSILV